MTVSHSSASGFDLNRRLAITESKVAKILSARPVTNPRRRDRSRRIAQYTRFCTPGRCERLSPFLAGGTTQTAWHRQCCDNGRHRPRRRRHKTIRVGAGGITLPNHAPLVIAEQFETLATLNPDRIDLGLGRASGTDGVTAHALRRNMEANDNFPQDVVELLSYFEDASEDSRIRAVPSLGTHVPVWILGSSLYGAQLAAHLGLPYAFASHFAPAMLEGAIANYRTTFRPSQWLANPYFMMAAGVCAANTDEEALYLRSSQILAFARLRTGRPGQIPHPATDLSAEFPRPSWRRLNSACVLDNGHSQTVHNELEALVTKYQPDELIVNGMIHDHAARLKSF